MEPTTFAFPTTIRFGPGARRLLGEHLHHHGVSRPLVVTDEGVAKLPFFAELLGSLRDAGHSVAEFSAISGDPDLVEVAAGADAYGKHGADCVVGIGGGAALDAAKAVLVARTQGGDLLDYEDRPGARSIEGPLPPFLAVPTTAGTGSEVGRSAVISDGRGVKRILFSPHLLAREVFADPELTVGLPPAITAATGMDALTHNVEAYLASGYHPICDGIAVEGVRLCARHLPRAVQDGEDLEARAGMLVASMMGAIAFQKGLGVVHSCAHSLGTVAKLHHGLSNALMIDHALAFNLPRSGDRLSYLASVIGLDPPSPHAFLDWLADLRSRVGIDPDLRSYGVHLGQIDDLVEVAFADGCHQSNPRKVSADDLRQIFEQVLR